MQKVAKETMFQKLIYLASPHTSVDPMVREVRYLQAMKALAQLVQEGHLVFSPIVHTHELAKTYAWPMTFDYYAKLDLAWLEKVDELWVLMLEGWDESKGVTAEIKKMDELNKPIIALGWDNKEGIVSMRKFSDIALLSLLGG